MICALGGTLGKNKGLRGQKVFHNISPVKFFLSEDLIAMVGSFIQFSISMV
jgi:hypothetical protein